MPHHHDKQFLGGGRAKMQTYLIIGGLLVIAVVVGNLAFNNPTAAKDGVSKFLGLPGWAFPIVMFVVGIIIFGLGMKLETDWPEAIGALLIAGAVFLMEVMVGWDTFAFGGIVVLPYIIPIAVFVVLLFYGMQKSK
jgi:hypothetical protein